MTTRIALDPVELRGASRLLGATADHLRAEARSFQRQTSALGGVTPAMQGYVGDSLQGLSSRTQATCDRLEQDGLVLAAIASYIEAAEASGREVWLSYRLVSDFYSAIALIGKKAEQLGLQPAAFVRLVPAGVSAWDDVLATLDIPALGRAAGAAGWLLDGYRYYYESGGDWSETIFRTGLTGAGGAAGGALGTAGCGLLLIEGGIPGFLCFAIGAIGGGAVGDWAGEKLTSPPTFEEVAELSDRVAKLPEPVQEQFVQLLESGEYDVYEALRTIEMNFGHLDDPQIDDDPLDP